VDIQITKSFWLAEQLAFYQHLCTLEFIAEFI